MKPIVLIILLVLFFIVRTGSGYASNKPVYPSLSCDCSKNEIDILQMRAYWDVVDANEYDYIMTSSDGVAQSYLLQIFGDYAARRQTYDTLMNNALRKQDIIQLTMNNYKMAKAYYKLNGDPTNGNTIGVLDPPEPSNNTISDEYYTDLIPNLDKTAQDELLAKITAYKSFVRDLLSEDLQ